MEATPDNLAGRGAQTREALIEAGMRIFGRDGFEAASTRAIAEAAGINQALIGYHFRNKDGLYRAVFEHITGRLRERLGPLLDTVREELGSPSPAARVSAAQRERALEHVLRIIDAMAALMARGESAMWARLILAEQQAPSAAFSVLYGEFMGPALGLLAQLVGRVRRSDPAATETRLLVATLLGQVLVFRAARAGVLRHLGWDDIGDSQFEAIRVQLRRNVIALLTGD